MDLSFTNKDNDLEDAQPNLFFNDAILQFEDESAIPPNNFNVVIFGQPVEFRDAYIMEKRIGCDAAAFVLKKYIASIPFVNNHNLDLVNIISFLFYYLTDPIKVVSEQQQEFYVHSVFDNILKKLSEKKIDVRLCQFIDIAGSIDVLLYTINKLQTLLPNEELILLKFSPFGYNSYLSHLQFKTYHFGIDKKYGSFEKPNELNEYLFYDIDQGADFHLLRLKEILSQEKKLVVIWDCQVFSSEYFPGTPVPFPFSYSLAEITKLLKLVNQNSKKVCMVGVCHFNPAVEEKKSAFFLVEAIYNFINSLGNQNILK